MTVDGARPATAVRPAPPRPPPASFHQSRGPGSNHSCRKPNFNESGIFARINYKSGNAPNFALIVSRLLEMLLDLRPGKAHFATFKKVCLRLNLRHQYTKAPRHKGIKDHQNFVSSCRY